MLLAKLINNDVEANQDGSKEKPRDPWNKMFVLEGR